MHAGHLVGDPRGRAQQHVLPLAQANLPDRADQRRLRRQAEFPVEVAGWRSRAELLEIDAVVDHVHFFRRQSARHVERARGVRHGQQPCVAVQIGHGLGAEPDDVAQMAEAGQAQMCRHRSRQPSHRQAVGVQAAPADADAGLRTILRAAGSAAGGRRRPCGTQTAATRCPAAARASANGPCGGAITTGVKPAARTPSSVASIDRSPPLSVAYSQRRKISRMDGATLGSAGQ